MNKIIYHGSDRIIEHPNYFPDNKLNDYGQGFYCTENIDCAGGWACKDAKDAFINVYNINMSGLKVCNFNSSKFSPLNVLATLLEYRCYWQKGDISEKVAECLKTYRVDISGYDVVIGCRADDSYFSFFRDFLKGKLSVQRTEAVIRGCRKESQFVLKSAKAFDRLEYLKFIPANADKYYVRKVADDEALRKLIYSNAEGNIEETYVTKMISV